MDQYFLARQAIYDCNLNIVAYELLYRDSDTVIKEFPSNLKATLTVISSLIHINGAQEFFPNHVKLFVNCENSLLNRDILKLINPSMFVIEILEHTIITEDVIYKVKELHGQGYQIALDDFNCTNAMLDKFKPIFPYLTYLKVCLNEVDISNSEVCCNYLRSTGIILLAEKVETKEIFERCRDYGFTLFQGYYFSKPETIMVEC